MARTRAGSVYVSVQARTDKFKQDIQATRAEVERFGQSAITTNSAIVRSTDSLARSSFNYFKLAGEGALTTALAHQELTAAIAKFAIQAALGQTKTDLLVRSYRGIRIALSPTPFTLATVAAGILTEELIKLTLVRAKIIEQQALFAATSNIPVANVERLDNLTEISGSKNVRGLFTDLSGRTETNRGNVESGLSTLGIRFKNTDIEKLDPSLLGKIAAGFASIEDPAKRAAAAVALFGADKAGEALEQLSPAFASASQAASRYGVVLSDVSRRQIFAFREDLLKLNDALFDTSNLRTLWESFTTVVVSGFASINDYSNKATHSVNQFLDGLSAVQTVRGSLANGGKINLGFDVAARQREVFSIQNNRAADALLAIETATRARKATNTLEGARAERDLVESRANKAYEELASNKNLTGDQRLQRTAKISSDSAYAIAIRERIKVLEAAEEAEKKATAATEDLARFQAGAPERIKALYTAAFERTLKTPIAQEIVRGSFEVRKDSDRTSDAEKTARADIATRTLQDVVRAEQTKFGQEWEKSVIEAEQVRRKWFQTGLESQIRKDENFVQAGNRIRESLIREDATQIGDVRDRASFDSQLAGIRSGGDEAALAGHVLAIRQKAIEVERGILAAHAGDYDIVEETARLQRESNRADLDYQQQIAQYTARLQQSALSAGGALQQRLRLLDQEIQALNAIQVTSQNIRDVEAARKALQDQRLQLLRDELLRSGSIQDGWKAFFVDMQREAAKPGRILYEGLQNGLDSISDNLANLFSGQSTNWARDLQQIGHEIQKSAIKGVLQTALSSIYKPKTGPGQPSTGNPVQDAINGQFGGGSTGGLIFNLLKGKGIPVGIGPNSTVGLLGKPDGTRGNPFYVIAVQQTQKQEKQPEQKQPGFWGTLFGTLLGSLAGVALGSVGGGSGDSGSSGYSTSVFRPEIEPRANGGLVNPRSAYLVGERGPELVTGMAGRVYSNRETQNMLGGGPTYNYYVDARGSNGPELIQAMKRVHESSVSTGIQANIELSKRRPGGR